jgi:hypothetical protein
LEAPADDEVAHLLGLDRSDDFGTAERESPDVLLWVGHPDGRPDIERMLAASDAAAWYGCANQLSANQVRWPDIDSIRLATIKPRTRELSAASAERRPLPAAPALDLSFAQVARQRRSAVDFDGTTSITSAAFFAMLECLMTRSDTPPWNALVSPAAVHPALLVHRVEGACRIPRIDSGNAMAPAGRLQTASASQAQSRLGHALYLEACAARAVSLHSRWRGRIKCGLASL